MSHNPNDDTGAAEHVDESVDTTDGHRDPLSTDDGLSHVAEEMAAVEDDRRIPDPGEAGEAGDPSTETPRRLDLPGLQLEPNASDPLADLAREGA